MFCVVGSAFGQASLDRIKKRVNLDVRFETQNSFAATEYVFFWGLKLGIDLDRRVKFGFGYTWLQSRYFSDRFDPDKYPSTNRMAQPRFRYYSAYMEYDFYKEGRWEFSAPVEMGFGYSFYRNDDVSKMGRGFNWMTIFGLNTTYMFSKWVGFGVGVGYRIVLLRNKQMDDQFSAPYYQVKLKIGFSEILRLIKGPKKHSKE
jgi:hypothetical protein